MSGRLGGGLGYGLRTSQYRSRWPSACSAAQIRLSPQPLTHPPAPTPDLVNTNVWSHNLLVLIQRHVVSSEAKALATSDGGDAVAAGLLDPLADAEAAVTVLDSASGAGGCQQAANIPRCSSDHARLPWLAATTFVVSYSFLLSMSVPYFSTLVGIVASSTYLICAYT